MKIGYVYALCHKPTAKFLIGSTTNLKNRISQWKTAFFYKKLPAEVMAVSQDFDTWEIMVLKKLELKNPKDKKHLRFLETQAIVDHHVRFPEHSLNTARFGWGPTDRVVAKSTYYARLRARWDPVEAATVVRHSGFHRKTTITDEDGNTMTYTQAAARLGCKLATLQRRLKNKRKKNPGATHVTLHRLLADTRQWRQDNPDE